MNGFVRAVCWLVPCGGLFFVSIDTPALGSGDDRPNVLWIIGEDLGPELGCYGHPEVHTPNLDRLARNGMRFTQAFATAPVCSASRSALMTGMYQTTIGAHNHRSHRDDDFRLSKGARLLTHRLQEAGYFTANIRNVSEDVRGTGKTDWNFQYDGKAFESDNWSDLKSHQPFYAQINFSETHRGAAWDNSHTRIDKTADPQKIVIPPYYPDHRLTREDWAQYLNTVMALDGKVGHILNRLEADGLSRNTVVIFFGDHGRAMVRGKQWCYDSGLHVPLIAYWPKTIPVPNRYKPSSVSDRLVSLIDLTATTLAIAGVPKPANLQGRILFGTDADEPRDRLFAARDRCDETVFRIRTVRDQRYRYIRNFFPERPFLQLNRYKERQYPVIHLMRYLKERDQLDEAQLALLAPRRAAEELYDVVNDPYEINNLAKSPQHQSTLERMRASLHQWIEKTNDLGRIPEPPKSGRTWSEHQQKKHAAGIEKTKQEVLDFLSRQSASKPEPGR